MTCVPDGLEVDHRNHDRLDNRKANLRIVPHAKQQQNLSKYKTHNGQPTASQYRGVGWLAREKRWLAKVVVGGVVVFYRLFTDEETAAAAARAARLAHMSHTIEDPAPVVVSSRRPLSKPDGRQPAAPTVGRLDVGPRPRTEPRVGRPAPIADRPPKSPTAGGKALTAPGGGC
jgi:hypothetical protein